MKWYLMRMCAGWLCPFMDSRVFLKSLPHFTGRIWKQRLHFGNTSNVFRPHYAGESEDATTRAEKSRKRKPCVFKFLRFEERQKVLLAWRISVDGRPNLRSKTAFLDGALIYVAGFGISVVHHQSISLMIIVYILLTCQFCIKILMRDCIF